MRDDGGEAGIWESKSKPLDLVDLVDILFPVPAGSLARRAEPLPIVPVRRHRASRRFVGRKSWVELGLRRRSISAGDVTTPFWSYRVCLTDAIRYQTVPARAIRVLLCGEGGVCYGSRRLCGPWMAIPFDGINAAN